MAILAFFYLIYNVVIRAFLMRAHYYKAVFQLTAVFYIVTPPAAILILFMPKVSRLGSRLAPCTALNLFSACTVHSLGLCTETTGKKCTESLSLKVMQSLTNLSIITVFVSKWHD